MCLFEKFHPNSFLQVAPSRRKFRLTLLGRSVFLLALELLVNGTVWCIAAILFGRDTLTRDILSLALLAWTIGLRHALDADHISAIDNATRSLINLGQLPVTCGLYFSLGHSTIVIAVNVAIAISTDVANRLGGVGSIGSIVGTAVSAAFLFLIGLTNTIILWRLLRRRRQRNRERQQAGGCAGRREEEPEHSQTLMLKILGPITTFVNRPWKMYPVGVLFGFGFDTASSIALLAVSALAKEDSSGQSIPQGSIIVLPFLFTCGMTLVDSIDSVLMLYSYAGLADRTWALFHFVTEDDVPSPHPSTSSVGNRPMTGTTPDVEKQAQPEGPDASTSDSVAFQAEGNDTTIATTQIASESPSSAMRTNAKKELLTIQAEEQRVVKLNTMSNLSVVLTLISIIVAFSISLIEILGLIGSYCEPCLRAASAGDGHGRGLAGRWWRAWSIANDQLGVIGACIVGIFVVVLLGWYVCQWAWKVRVRRSGRGGGPQEEPAE